MRKGFEHPPGLSIEVSPHPFAFSITERGLFFKYLIWSCLRASSPGRSERRAGKGRRACNYVFRIWIFASKKSMQDADMAEMTLVMTSLPFARGFQGLFTFALVSTSGWLAEIWQLCRRGVTGELEFKFQRRSVWVLLPFLQGLKPGTKLSWELARRLNLVTLVQHNSDENHCCITILGEMRNQLHFTHPKCR